MAESSYRGGCHCGAVRYRVDLDLERPAIACNCSMCGRAGTLLVFTPASKFSLEQGEAELTDYQFNKHLIHHLFCKTCGIKSFARGKNADGSDMVAVNARCLEDVDLATIPTHQFDGKSRVASRCADVAF
jgi:hypothetical protein